MNLLEILYDFNARLIYSTGGNWHMVRWRWNWWTRWVGWNYNLGKRRAQWEYPL